MNYGCNNPSGGSSIATNHTPLLKPPGEFDFTQIRAADGKVKIVWESSSRADSYAFFMGTDPAVITTPVASCSGGTASCQLTGLDVNTLYYFSVVAANAAGTKKITSTGKALSVDTTGFDITASNPSNGTVAYTWTPAAANTTSYNLIYGTSPGSYPSIKTNVTSPYTLTGLTNGITYYARVVAVNTNNGYGVSPTEVSDKPVGPLPAPTGLSAVATPNVITLDWTDTPGAIGYEIWDSTGSTMYGTSVTSTYTHTHNSNGTSYSYKVRALNVLNAPGAYSSVVSAQSINSFAITSANAGPLPGEVTVTWSTPVTGATGYDILYGSNSSSLNLRVNNATSPAVIGSLTGGLTYYFRVVAKNAVGNGTTQNSSNQLSATPVIPVGVPTGVTISATPSAVTLNWTAVPGASGGYHVYRNTSSGGHTFLGNAASNTYIDNTATPDGTTYYYVVRSFNGLESANSSEVFVRPISNFSFTSATVATFASADLIWGSAVGATGYDILYGTTSGTYTGSSLNRTSPTTLTGLSASTTYYVAIRAKNATTTVLSNERTFTTGTLYPTVTITPPSLINNANKTSYTVTGTCSEEGRTVSLNIGGVTGTNPCTSGAWSITLNVTAAADSASRSVVATHTNSGGNSDTDTVNVVKDTVNPTVAITTYPAINSGNQATYTVSGTCSENTRTVNVAVGGITATPVCTSSAWSATVNATSLSDSATISITADHTDAVANSATQATRTIVKDTVAPAVAISSSPVINNANKASYSVSGTCSETGENVVVKVGSVTSTVSCTLLSWSATLNVTAVADAGGVVVTADHSDAAGNIATQASALVLKDTVPPAVAITSTTAIISTNDSAYPISGTCSENSRNVVVTVGGISATVVCSTGAWSAVLDVSSLSDGPAIAATAQHSDSALNSTTVSTTFLKQTALPTVAITSSTAINNTNKAAYVVSGTCSHNGRAVNVSVGGVTAAPVCTATAWTATVNATIVSDSGAVAITADHVDAVGNAAVQATASVLKDTVIPTVAITSSPAINNTNKSAYVVSGTCSENARTVSVSVGAVSSTPSCSTGTWSATVNVSALADNASVAVTANHTDLAGNAATQASATVLKDTVVPTVAITSSPAINNNNKSSYTVSGTCSENTRTVSVNVGGVTGTPTCTSFAWTTTLNVSSLSDGASVSVTANHSDLAGNNATQASATVLKDTSLPTVAITVSPVVNNANKNAYTFSGTCSETGQTVSVAVGATTGSVTCSLLTWSATLNVSANGDSGTLIITADHTDAAGNQAVQAGTSVVKDTVNPTVAITSSPAITNSNKSAYTVAGTCSENGRVVSLSVGGVTATPSCSSSAWSATLNVSALADNPSVAITANHSDSAGNNATQASTTVVKLTALPTVTITSSPVINNANKAAYTVSGACSENTRQVSVSVGGVAGTPTCTSSAWTVTLNVTAVADNGSVSITADHTDAVGNAATQATASALKDTVNPTVAITSSTVINAANVSAYTVSGTCSENGRTVSVAVGSVSGTPSCSSGSWSVSLNVTPVADNGAVSVTANHTDAAGNAATQATATVVKDTSVPTVAITVYPIINNANKAAYTVSGTCSENTRTVSVSVGGVTATPTCTSSAWTATLNVTAVADNASVSITADHSDSAGNNATQATRTVLKDTSNPTVAITSSPVINNANKASYTVTGTCSENTRTVSVSVGSVSGTPTCSSNTWSTTLNVTAVADNAAVAITADHSDAAGNAATQASTTVLKDTVVPTVAITAPANIISSNAAAYTVNGTCSENGRTVSLSVGGITATPTCSGGAWTATLNVTGLSDSGSISITANHSDVAGNNATQASATVQKVTGLPTVAITSSAAINNTNKASYPVSGTCSENTRTVSVSVGGVTASPTCTSGSWSASVNVSALADSGTVAMTADHSDSLGNSAIQATASVVKDTVIPTVAITSSPVINNANKATYTFSGTCSENTRTVTVNAGGVAGSATCTSGAWSATVNVTAVADSGSISLTANHTDAAGNAATQATASVVKDTSNPTLAITSSPAINNTNKSSYPLSGTCSENTRTVSVTVGGITGSATCTTGAWSASVDVSALADSGTVAVTADHTDAAGNAATQATATVAKDTIIPTIAITSSPSINNSNKAVYPIGGTCSENGRTVTVAVGGVSGTVTCTTGTWSRTLNVTAVSDSATVAVTADISDTAGNNAVQATATVAKDVIVPTVSITAPVAINNTNKASYPVSGSCSENTRTVSVSVGGVSGSATCTTLAWTVNLNVTSVGDGGAISVTADHSDAAGNNATQATSSVSKDTTNPTVAITSSPAINNTNKSAYTFSGTCSENTRSVSVSAGGVSATPTCSSGNWSATVDVSSLSDSGTVSLTADHTDAAGNSATQATATVVKDTIVPTVAITSSPSINNANKAAYVVSGTCSENSRTVSVSVGAVSSSPTCTTNAWTATLNVTTVSDSATVSVTANHTDAAGNSATQASATVLKDTSNPTVAITSAPSINNTNKTSYPVSGTCSENTLTVNVSVGGITATPACTTGNWSTSVDASSLSDGPVTVTANHADAAGNNATQASTSVTKDTANPTVAITSSGAINNTNKAVYPVSGTCSENTRSVTVSVGGVGGSATCSSGTWSTTVNATSVSDSASVSITANHTDAAGNSATQASATVLKDVVIPLVAITSSPVINNTNKAAYTFSGTCSENTRTVSVSVGSVNGTPTCTSGAWSSTLNVTAVADGAAVTITANHTDAAGNAATQASTTVLKDTNVPTVAISAPTAINNSNKSAYVVSGACSENSRTVSVSVGGVTSTPTCSSNVWLATMNVSALADNASIAITADHSDVNGNIATQATASALKDTVIPTVAITSSPAINNSNKSAYTVSGTCSENTRTVSVAVGAVNSSPTCTSGNWSATLNVSALADNGSISVIANHTDAAGNAATQASTTVVKDTGLPTVAINAPAVINNSNKTTYNVTGTCSETGRTVTVNVGSVNTTDTCTLLTWSVTVDISGNPDSGTLLITADHSDAAGNTAVQAGTSVVKDTVNPTVAITAPVAIKNSNKTAYTVSGSCSENTRTVSVMIGSVSASPSCSGGSWTTGAINVSAATDSATLSITANHTDSAGNTATQASTTVVKDTANPTVAITSAPTVNIANVSSWTVSGTCSENGVNVTISSGALSIPAMCTAGAWTFTGNVSSIADNTALPLTVTQVDAVGNSGSTSSTVLKDTVAPTVTLSTAASEPTSASSFTVRATFSETVTGMVLADFVVGNGTASGFTAVSGVAYDITVTPTAPGSVTINMAASAAADVANNPSTVATQLARTYQNPAVLAFQDTSTYDFGTIATGGSADVTMTILKTGTPNATTVTEISLAAPFAFKGGSFPGTGGTCTTTISANCSIVVTFTPTAAGVRNGFVQLQYNNGTSTVTTSRAITGTGVVLTPTKIEVAGPSGIMINQCVPYTIYSQTSAGLQANVTANQTVNLTLNNGTGAYYSNSGCTTTATSTIIATGTSSKVIYFKATTTGQNLTLVFNPTSLTPTTKYVETTTTPTKIAVSPPVEMATNKCVPVVVSLVDASGNKSGKATSVQVNLTDNGNANYYSDSICSGLISSTTFAAFEESRTVYVMNPTVQSVTFTFTDNAASLTTATANVSFVSSLTWWNNAYYKRIPITLNNLDQAVAHTNIPVLVRLNSSRINYADILAGGADIRFTLSDHTTTLSYDIESWNASGESLVWVKIPSISASSQRVIYMYYDNASGTNGESAASTWTGYSGIWNMDKSGAQYVDATGSGKNGTTVGTVADFAGPSGNAIYVNGSAAIDTGYNLALVIGKTSTLSFWIRSTQAGNDTTWLAPGITGVEEAGGNNDIFFGFMRAAGTINVAAGNGATAASNYLVNDNNWRYVTMSRNETTGAVKFYVNGVLNGSGTSESGAKTTSFTAFGYVRNTGGAANYFNGYMDSIRMSNVILDDNRIRAEYKFSIETNITYGATEDL